MVMPPMAPPPATAPQHGAVGGLTQEKACQILEDGEVRGVPLTTEQKALMGAVCSGQGLQRAEGGAVVVPRDWPLMWEDANGSDPGFQDRLTAEVGEGK